MRLRDQALIPLLAACLASGGCARLLSTILAPQEAAMSAAGQVANTVSAPAQSELSRMGGEVDRLLAGKAGSGGSREELQKIKADLDRRNPAKREPEGSAQDDPERLRPWHPRATKPDPTKQQAERRDSLGLGRAKPERGLAASGLLPDGTPAADLRSPVDTSRIRLKQ